MLFYPFIFGAFEAPNGCRDALWQRHQTIAHPAECVSESKLTAQVCAEQRHGCFQKNRELRRMTGRAEVEAVR